eukprot:comp15310_c0_seq1/m.12154 comp15310_c0_seq1/g.12154  ORF comp15310_c0_seq1/g.12154 comp15310_c0_seq1/m.12154 type:complete len:466 (-) comp15310_c0_seq1:51-1448(-)
MAGAVMEVVNNVIPMYGAIVLGYLCAWRKIISQQGYEGLQIFVVNITIPALTFGVLIRTDLYNANPMVVAAGLAQAAFQLILLLSLATVSYFYLSHTTTGSRVFRMDLVATGFAILNFPNVLVVGVPMLLAMYGNTIDYLLILLVVIRQTFLTPTLVVLYEIYKVRTDSSSRSSSIHVSTDNVTDKATDARSENEEVQTNQNAGIAPATNEQRDDVSSVHEGIPVVAVGAASIDDVTPETVTPNMHATKQTITPILRAPPKGAHPSLHHHKSQVPELAAHASDIEAQATKVKTPHHMQSIIWEVFRRLLGNSVLYAAILGIAYSLIAYGVDKNHTVPTLLDNFLKQFSNCLSGVAFFNIGFSMKATHLIPPKRLRIPLVLSFLMRFLSAPCIMGVIAYVVGLRGLEWRAVTLQSALPQAIIPYSLAKHYDVHHELLGFSVTIGTLISLPVVVIYYFLFDLNPNFP